MDSAQWPQVAVKSTEDEEGRREVVERRAKAGKDQILNCPRCNSNNTKFCYYNNYSLSQPRYFCKSCRRYWTAGGSLRNIPVGGASRKNKRPSATIFSSPKNNKIINIDDHEDQSHNPITTVVHSFATSSCCNWLSSDHDHDHHDHDHHHDVNQMMMMRSNGMAQRELIPFMPMPAAAAPQQPSMCSAAPDQCNPSRNMNVNNEGLFGGEENGEDARRLMEDFKQLPTIISGADQSGGKLGDVPAFWNGIFGGSSW